MGPLTGWTGSGFHMVLAPAMFPGGGYGATIIDPERGPIVYEVVRENGASNREPEFPAGRNLQVLALHEWGHAYVNPSLDALNTRLAELEPLYTRVRRTMARQAYGNRNTFFNEQVLRALTALAELDLYGREAYDRAIASNEARGFYLTRFTVEQLQYYAAHRDQYPRFTDFAPYLLDRYGEYLDEHPSRPVGLYLLGLAAVLLAAGVLWRRSRARRPGPTHPG